MSPREEEFTAFVEARRPHLLRLAWAICGDPHRADDLVQTALTKLYLAWPRLERDGAIEAYVRQIIVRADIDESRRPWRRERPAEIPDRPDAPEPDGVFELLQSLPAMQRKVVVLRHWLQLSVAETAEALGIGEGTVKSHSARGLAALRLAVLAADHS